MSTAPHITTPIDPAQVGPVASLVDAALMNVSAIELHRTRMTDDASDTGAIDTSEQWWPTIADQLTQLTATLEAVTAAHHRELAALQADLTRAQVCAVERSASLAEARAFARARD